MKSKQRQESSGVKLEHRLGNRIDEEDPLTQWVPRRAANCVSRYRLMDEGRTPDQTRCGKTCTRPVVEFGESLHFQNSRREQCNARRRLLRGVYVGHHGRSGAATFLTLDSVKRGMRIARMLEQRDGIASLVQHARRSPMAAETRTTKAVETR